MTSDDSTFAVQQKIERIRRRMMANIPGSSKLRGADEAAESYEIVDSEYPELSVTPSDYGATDKHLEAALEISQRMSAAKEEIERQKGPLATLRRMARHSFRWYTAPEEEYWDRVLGSMRHIVVSFKEHEAFVQTYAAAVRDLQEQNVSITGVLTGIRRDMMTSRTEATEKASSVPERREEP